jgi:hypothetical protein
MQIPCQDRNRSQRINLNSSKVCSTLSVCLKIFCIPADENNGCSPIMHTVDGSKFAHILHQESQREESTMQTVYPRYTLAERMVLGLITVISSLPDKAEERQTIPDWENIHWLQLHTTAAFEPSAEIQIPGQSQNVKSPRQNRILPQKQARLLQACNREC